jgi:hypothetical protein
VLCLSEKLVISKEKTVILAKVSLVGGMVGGVRVRKEVKYLFLHIATSKIDLCFQVEDNGNIWEDADSLSVASSTKRSWSYHPD